MTEYTNEQKALIRKFLNSVPDRVTTLAGKGGLREWAKDKLKENSHDAPN
jgi:hypothetical protein